MKITDPDLLRVGTEITLDLTARTYTLNLAGNLSADGVTLQAIYSKLKELWLTMPYQLHPFPMYAIDAEAGKYQLGTDGANFSGWKPADDATRNLHRDGGWEEYAAAAPGAQGALLRQYVGIVTLGTIDPADQLYYQRAAGGVARNFVYLGPVNEGVQIFGDAANGNFDERAYFKVFARTAGKSYSQSDLGVIAETNTGPRKMTFAVSAAIDGKIVAADGAMAGAPYSGITVTYFGADQNKSIGGTPYPFRIVINGNGATKGQIYTRIQHLLRQNADIDAGAGTVTGKTADALLSFDGDTLVTARGVYIENYDPNDTNGIRFTDQNGTPRTEPFVAAGTIAPNANLQADGTATYRMMFETLPGSQNYGTGTAVTVNDAAGNPIAGLISGRAAIPFTFAYDSNAQGGRAPGGDAAVVVIASGTNGAKFVMARGTISRATGQVFALVSEKERSYKNAA